MGAAHSSEPRSVSMDNPTPAGVIDVSDEVVQRLKKGLSKKAKDNAASPPPPPPPKKEAPVKAAPKAAQTPQPTVVYQNPAPIYVQSGGPTLSAMDVRRQMEDELQKNDALWRQRMSQLEQTLKKTNVLMEQEYSAAVDDVRKRFSTAAPTHQLPPCQDLKAKIIACYRANPGETLKCAEEVAMFRNCVSEHRIKKLDAAGEAEKQSATKSATAAAKPVVAADSTKPAKAG